MEASIGCPDVRQGEDRNRLTNAVTYLGPRIDHRLTWLPAVKLATFKATRVQTAVGKLLCRGQGCTPRLALQLYEGLQRQCKPTHCPWCSWRGAVGAATPHGDSALHGTPAPVARGCFIGGDPNVASVTPYAATGAASCGPSPQGPRGRCPPSETAEPTSFTDGTDLRTL
ncbi:hypothetical protein HPB52_025470 [Rhipicephalus sanguineus]|uniref:Uncharacterized protein n=1 Tax=Rhipicephalus sanguineus TaxID=34632 RepID=A0A9D4SM89_RHISA|nr:hypothetical protein HPB52_025470 [Rhipicephalus sanguineus]